MEEPGTPTQFLNISHRMPARLTDIVSKVSYNELLLPSKAKEAKRDSERIFWIPISGKEENSGLSKVNVLEAEEIKQFLEKTQHDPQYRLPTMVITPYAAQYLLLQKILEGIPNVRVKTIDFVQGGEEERVVFSLVATKKVGFLADRHRVNVAFTESLRNGRCCTIGSFWSSYCLRATITDITSVTAVESAPQVPTSKTASQLVWRHCRLMSRTGDSWFLRWKEGNGETLRQERGAGLTTGRFTRRRMDNDFVHIAIRPHPCA